MTHIVNICQLFYQSKQTYSTLTVTWENMYILHTEKINSYHTDNRPWNVVLKMRELPKVIFLNDLWLYRAKTHSKQYCQMKNWI